MASFFENIMEEIKKVSTGNGNFNTMLYAWGVAPGVILTIFIQRKIDFMDNVYMQFLLYLIFFLYFLWHFFVVRKTLKVQPEHKVVKPSKKELYEGKSKEEIKQIKDEKRKETLQKMFLLRAWDTTPIYVIVECFDVYLFLTQVQGLYNIITR